MLNKKEKHQVWGMQSKPAAPGPGGKGNVSTVLQSWGWHTSSRETVWETWDFLKKIYIGC